jgi:hypothetical protein
MQEKVYITKYALTKGIYHLSAEIDGKYAHATLPGAHFPSVFSASEWTRSKIDAEDRATDMRCKKIKALERKAAVLVRINTKIVEI